MKSKKTHVFCVFSTKKTRENQTIQKSRPPVSMVLSFWISEFFFANVAKKCFLHTILCLQARPMHIIHTSVH